MNIYNLMQTHSVIVNNGSGVLVNAMSDEYSYVLTVRHALQEENILTSSIGDKIKIIDVYVHSDPNRDCAIIKIEHPLDVKQELWSVDTLEHHAALMVVGYPETRRSNQNKYKNQDGRLTSYCDKGFVLTADGIPGKDLIEGMSGGGVYYIKDARAYLVGVEYGMDGEKVSVEHYGRLQCHNLSQFEEIIDQENIAPMMPQIMESFSRLKNDIFSFNVIDPNNTSKLRERLGLIADTLLRNNLPMPYNFFQRHDRRLLLSTECSSAIFDKELWIAYFEFVIICSIIDDIYTIDDEYLSTLDKKRRIVYSRSDKHWVRNLGDILKCAKQMLDRNGTIIVNSLYSTNSVLPPLNNLKYIIDDISSIPQNENFLQIDNANENIYETFTITNYKGLCESCVVEKENEYGKAMPSELLTLFKEYYNEFIK